MGDKKTVTSQYERGLFAGSMESYTREGEFLPYKIVWKNSRGWVTASQETDRNGNTVWKNDRGWVTQKEVVDSNGNRRVYDENGYLIEETRTAPDSSCYLTTAAVTHKGLPDDCLELRTLRGLRNQMQRTRSEE